MEILDGRKVANEIYDNLANEVQTLNTEELYPKLVVILVGNDLASLSYIKQKRKACEKTGIIWDQINYETSVTTNKLIEKIHELNEQSDVHGILVQLPLPKHIYEPEVIKAIDPQKDVDGFTAYNLGKMFISPEFEHLPPCTPAGVIDLLDRYKIEIKGQNVTIVGASNIVGKPLATMFINRKATVTLCNSSTKDLKAETLKADIVAVGVGKRDLITADMVKNGVVLVDIGCNRKEDGKLCGDADFVNISKKAAFITPVPGGIGPMTVAHLMKNTVSAAKRLNRKIQ